MNTLPHHVDVLIVGAGPTGLALALALRRTGINACVVDKLACLQNTSRAAVLHAHTLDMLDDLGVTSRMLDEGLRIASFGLHDRDHKLARLNFDTLPSQHNCLLMLPQDRTEQILYDALCEAGGAVHWQTQCIDLQQVDQAGANGISTTGNVWGFLPGNVPGAKKILFEAHMDSVAPTTGTKVIRKDGILYSDGTTTLGGDDKVGIASALEALQIIKDEKMLWISCKSE